MKKNIKLAVLTAALVTSSIGFAQDKATLVKQFIDLQRPGVEALARGLVQQSSDPIAAAGSEYLRTQVPADKREAAGKAADAELRKYYDENYPIVRDRALAAAPGALGPVLEKNFSEDELKQLIAWISGPLSKKYQESTQAMQQALMEKVVADTRPTIEPKLQELNVTVAKALGAPVDGQPAPAPTARAPAKAPAKK